MRKIENDKLDKGFIANESPKPPNTNRLPPKAQMKSPCYLKVNQINLMPTSTLHPQHCELQTLWLAKTPLQPSRHGDLNNKRGDEGEHGKTRASFLCGQQSSHTDISPPWPWPRGVKMRFVVFDLPYTGSIRPNQNRRLFCGPSFLFTGAARNLLFAK